MFDEEEQESEDEEGFEIRDKSDDEEEKEEEEGLVIGGGDRVREKRILYLRTPSTASGFSSKYQKYIPIQSLPPTRLHLFSPSLVQSQVYAIVKPVHGVVRLPKPPYHPSLHQESRRHCLVYQAHAKRS